MQEITHNFQLFAWHLLNALPAKVQLFSDICKNIHKKRYIFVVNKNKQKWLFVTFLIEVFPDKDHCQGVEFAVG
jgi:hypothetical protein